MPINQDFLGSIQREQLKLIISCTEIILGFFASSEANDHSVGSYFPLFKFFVQNLKWSKELELSLLMDETKTIRDRVFKSHFGDYDSFW